MHTKKIGLILGYVGLVAPIGCSSGSAAPDGAHGGAGGAEADAGIAVSKGGSGGSAGSTGTTEADAAGSTKPAIRSSCGNQPILDDRWKDTTDECKACVDTQCCSQAQACADNAECKSLWECRAKCDGVVSTCMNDCVANLTSLPAQNGAFVSCRNTCKACIDVSTCREAPWEAPPKASYSILSTLTSYTGPGVVFPGVTVKVCGRADTECKQPLSQSVTAADGTVKLDVPSAPGFTDAYFEVTGPNVQSQLIFPKFFQARALLEAGTLSAAGNGALFGLLDSATASALQGAMGAKADPTTVGFATVLARSCANRNVSGMVVSSSGANAGTILEYLAGAAPSATATMTDGAGTGVFADHPPGPATFSVKDSATGETLGSVDAFVRAGFLSIVLVPPSP